MVPAMPSSTAATTAGSSKLATAIPPSVRLDSNVMMTAADGETLGLADGNVLGETDGLAEGSLDGLADGAAVGDALGDVEGEPDGDVEGDVLGPELGLSLGDADGLLEGLSLGLTLGDADGEIESALAIASLFSTSMPARAPCPVARRAVRSTSVSIASTPWRSP